jgi:hypothetical protein
LKSIKYAVFSAFLAGVTLAAEPSADAVRRCVEMTDSLARLVCYDQLHRAAPISAAAAPVAAATVVTAGAAAAVAASGPSLGEENLKGEARIESKAAKPVSLTAQVTSLREIRSYTYRIALDNGQLWQQEEMAAAFTIKVGDTVRIDKGKMGGYRLARVTNGKPGGTWIRVTRKE